MRVGARRDAPPGRRGPPARPAARPGAIAAACESPSFTDQHSSRTAVAPAGALTTIGSGLRARFYRQIRFPCGRSGQPGSKEPQAPLSIPPMIHSSPVRLRMPQLDYRGNGVPPSGPYQSYATVRPSTRQRPGVVVSIQSSGSAMLCGVAAVANARLMACFDSVFSALGSGETNSAVPLRATTSSHLELKSQGSCGVIGAQSASKSKKARC